MHRPGHIVLDGDRAPHGKGHNSPIPTLEIYRQACACVRIIRGPCLLWPDGWMDQDAICTELGLGSGDIVLDAH